MKKTSTREEFKQLSKYTYFLRNLEFLQKPEVLKKSNCLFRYLAGLLELHGHHNTKMIELQVQQQQQQKQKQKQKKQQQPQQQQLANKL